MPNTTPLIKGQQTADKIAQKNNSTCIGGIAAATAGYWAGDAMLDKDYTSITGTDGALYYIEGGSLKKTVILPGPGASSGLSSPAADEIVVVDTRVWATDLNSGNLYRYDVQKSGPKETGDDKAKVVYTAKEAHSQLTGMAELDGILWFVDTTNTLLQGLSVTDNKPVLDTPFDLGKNFDKSDDLTISRIIADPDTHSLWMLVVDNSTAEKTALLNITPTTQGTATTVALSKTVVASYARAVTLHKKVIYLVTSAGALNTFDTVSGEAVETLLTIGSSTSISALTVDNADVLWCVQSGSRANNQVFEIDLNAKSVVAIYQLDDTASLSKKMAYFAAEDALLLPDLDANTRVMKLQPLDHIGPDGKSTLTIKADPAAENAAAGEVFKPFHVTVTDAAQSNKAVKALLNLNIISQKSSATATFGSGATSEPLIVDPAGTDVANLTAGSTDGQIAVQASIRGSTTPITIFTGTIGPVTTAIKFQNPPPKSVQTSETFVNSGNNAQIIKSDHGLPDGTKITLTIDDSDEKGATFVKGGTTVTVEDGAAVPGIVAGKFVGTVKINASVSLNSKTLQDSTTWTVTVKPVNFAPSKKVTTARPSQFNTLVYQVTGYKEQDNNKSEELGAAGVTVKLAAVSNVYFFEKNSPQTQLKEIDLVTDDTGTAKMTSGGKSYYCSADTDSKDALLTATAIGITVTQLIVDEEPK